MKRYIALKIATVYLIAGFFWILFSDRILIFFTKDINLLTQLQNYKGWFFIVITTILLYCFLQNEFSKRNKIAKELEKAKSKAEESDRLKTAFLSNMSHEIRTPLNGILGFSNLISKEELPREDKRLYAELISVNGHLLLKLINDIIDISKIQENMLSLNLKEFDFHQLLRNIMRTYSLPGSALLKKDLNLRLVNDIYSGPLMLWSDPDRLHQVLTNLVDNAIKYSDHGSIVIGYELKGKEIQIYVEDNGIGIEKEKQAMIFERFKQTSEQKYQDSGFGLGLSISLGITEALHGTIRVDSEPGKGSRFTVVLPLTANA